MRRVLKIALMVFIGMAALLTTSCVKDDRSKCAPDDGGGGAGGNTETRPLRLMFVPRQMDVTPTQADMNLAVVYIFDSEGNLIGTWTKQSPALNTSYDTGIILGDQTYRLISWVNPQAPYTVTPAYTLTPEGTTRSAQSDGRLNLNIPQDGNVTEPLPMLLYGSSSMFVAPKTDDDIEIPLTRDTYQINLTLTGFPLDGSTYQLKITDTNGAYDFENNFVDTQAFNYISTATIGTGGGTGNLTLSLNMLRLGSGRSPMISIVNTTTGQTVFPRDGQSSTNLMDLIGRTDVNLDTTHLINIEIPASDGVTGSVTIRINGWTLVIDDFNINPYE